MQSMDHTAERNKNEEMRQSTDRMTSLLSSALSNVSKELAWKIVGILFTNCFEFNIRDIDARALYPLVSLINHSCIPNLRHTNLIKMRGADLEGEIVVMELESQRTVLPGTQLTIRYNHYSQGHLQRQRFLLNQWYFRCRCQRCEDPSEFGTNTSGLPCERCSGLLLPVHPDYWQCNKCQAKDGIGNVRKKEDRLVAMAETTPSPYNITTSLQQLHTCSKLLHNNHFLVMQLKQKFLFNFSEPQEGEEPVLRPEAEVGTAVERPG